MKKNELKGFTLVELIVVITILAILGTIAFLSMQGFSSNARDSVRTTDLSNSKTSLSVYYTKVGTYPDPNNPISVTYSGAIVWNQGTFGNVPFKQLGDVSKLPTDPLTNNEYSYSTISTKTEYELAGVYEGAIAQNKELLDQTYAAQISGTTKIFGTYNGVQLYVQTGGTTFTLFSPTITTSDSTTTDLQGIITGNKLVLNGKNKLPINYQNGSFKDGTVNLGLTNIVILTGSISELTANTQSGKDLRKTYLTNLQSILTGSNLSSSYVNLTSLNPNDTSSDIVSLGIISGRGIGLGDNSIASTNSTPSNSCTTQPSITNGTGYTIGNPTSQNQSWTYSSTPGNCTYSCTNGYTGNDCSTAPVTQASCTTAGQILTASSTYPGIDTTGVQPAHSACNTADIIVCSGNGAGYTLSACNVGSNIAGITNSSYGVDFQWGRNKGFPDGDTTTQATKINGSIGLNASSDTYLFINENNYIWANTNIDNNWGHTTNTNISRQGPCSSGYHVPSQTEWQAILTLFGNNGTNIKNSLKLPSNPARMPGNGNCGITAVGRYWSSTKNLILSSNGHSYAKFIILDPAALICDEVVSMGMKVRCFKN